MDQSGLGNVAAFIAIVVAVGAGMVASFGRATAQTPAGIVRRLARAGRPVTVDVNRLNLFAWDPSRPIGHGGFYIHGRATYSLEGPATVRVRFVPRSGPAIERVGTIPSFLLPDSPAKRQRRRIARAVIALYLLIGLVAFGVTAAASGGSGSWRARLGALAALGAFTVTWVVAHLALTSGRPRTSGIGRNGTRRAAGRPARRALAWVVGLSIVAVALGIAWHLQSLTAEHPTSWASAFITAAIFVLVSAATVAASLHHHNFVYHGDHRPSGP